MNIAETYAERKNEIEKRLLDFTRIPRDKKTLFAEMVFCLLTPQSKAFQCDAAVKRLQESGALMKGTVQSVKKCIFNIRFNNQKTKSIIEARKHIGSLKAVVSMEPEEAREWLVSNVRGLGYKEASHFLRNVGSGQQLAILDRHILKNLAFHKVIEEVPKTLTRTKYMEIEEKMKGFSQEKAIPVAHIDLLFWSNETGKIFK